MFSVTFSGSDGVSKLVENGEIGVLEQTRCSPDKTDPKLQSNSPVIGDVQMVRIMYPLRLEPAKNREK